MPRQPAASRRLPAAPCTTRRLSLRELPGPPPLLIRPCARPNVAAAGYEGFLGGAAAASRKVVVKPEDRLFSWSSVTGQMQR